MREGDEKLRQRREALAQILAAEREIEREEIEGEQAGRVDRQQSDQRAPPAACKGGGHPCEAAMQQRIRRDPDEAAAGLSEDVVDRHRARRKEELRVFDAQQEHEADREGGQAARQGQRTAARQAAREQEAESAEHQQIGHPILPLIGAMDQIGHGDEGVPRLQRIARDEVEAVLGHHEADIDDHDGVDPRAGAVGIAGVCAISVGHRHGVRTRHVRRQAVRRRIAPGRLCRAIKARSARDPMV